MSRLGDALELMHQARHRAMPFDITIESRSRQGTTLVRVRRADGRLRVDEVPEHDDGGSTTLVEADGQSVPGSGPTSLSGSWAFPAGSISLPITPSQPSANGRADTRSPSTPYAASFSM
jgi:hypothetical protein